LPAANLKDLPATAQFDCNRHQQLNYLKITLLSQQNKIYLFPKDEILECLGNNKGLQRRIGP
jgi:hypothetical protein